MSIDDGLPRFGVGDSCPRPGSFEEFYRCERPRLDVFVRRMGATWEEAKDIAQDSMVAALLHWKEITNPRAWVRVAAVRKFLSQQERSRHGTELAHRSEWGVSSCYTPPATFEETELVLDAIGRLPSAQRQVMAWSIDGYAPGEIAGILGENAVTVRSNLRHARRRLAEWLTAAQLLSGGGTT
jgi:DNA-directed RNA polymerase specialized sigma24 family protein